MARPTKVKDIEQLEADFRAGVPSAATVARKHGISPAALSGLAKRRGWTRDLSAQVRARAKAKIAALMVSHPDADRDDAIIEEASDQAAAVIVRQRTNIERLLEITMQAGERVATEQSLERGEDPGEQPSAKDQAHAINSVSGSFARLYGPLRSVYNLDAPAESADVGITVYLPDNGRE